jgi:crotonobetaine/carnitine-CoA ligase
MRTFPPLELAFPDRRDWVFSRVLELRAQTHGDHPFLGFLDGPTLTYAETDRRVNRLAHGLGALGVGRGDRVLVMLPSAIEVLLVWWAANRLGAIAVPVNSAYKGYFLEHVVTNSGARVVVVAADFIDRLEALEDRLPHLETVVIWPAAGARPAFRRLRVLGFEAIETDREDPPGVELSPRDLCGIMYTSGTTGPSKGVMMPNAQCHLAAESAANLTRLTGDDCYLVTTPLYHGNAVLMQVYPTLTRGGRVVVAPGFSASGWVDQVRRSGATVTNLLGIMMEFVFRQPPRPADRDHRLRVVLGQPAPSAIAEEFGRRFNVKVLEYYGMTEIGIVTLMPWDGFRPGSCGVAVSEFFDLAIVDPGTDAEVAPGEVGELVVRPREPWAFNQGYWQMPDRTAEALRNVWYHTGDALRRDADGYYYFMDRIRDVIRRRAVNITSYDIERVVADHPAVAECAAVAVPLEAAGGEDEIKLCLVLRDGARLVPEEFLAWCEERLPYFAVPRYLEVLPGLPRTPSDKIQRHLLRRAGVTASTWDREKAGYRLQEEIRKAGARGQRRPAGDPEPPADASRTG